MVFAKDEKLINDWKNKLDSEGQLSDIDKFIKNIEDSNLRNSIFVDITASQNGSDVYEQLLKTTTLIVSCNKIAASSDFKSYS